MILLQGLPERVISRNVTKQQPGIAQNLMIIILKTMSSFNKTIEQLREQCIRSVTKLYQDLYKAYTKSINPIQEPQLSTKAGIKVLGVQKIQPKAKVGMHVSKNTKLNYKIKEWVKELQMQSLQSDPFKQHFQTAGQNLQSGLGLIRAQKFFLILSPKQDRLDPFNWLTFATLRNTTDMARQFQALISLSSTLSLLQSQLMVNNANPKLYTTSVFPYEFLQQVHIKFALRLKSIGQFIPLRIWKINGVQNTQIGIVDIQFSQYLIQQQSQANSLQQKQNEAIITQVNRIGKKRLILKDQIECKLRKSKRQEIQGIVHISYSLYRKKYL